MNFRSMIRAQEGKALGYVPELADHNTPITIRSGDGRPNRTPLSQREASRHLSAYGGKDAIDWVMSCVRLMAETASAADYHFEKNDERLYNSFSSKNPSGAKIADPLLVQLFEEPNPYMDWAELCELALIDYLLVGNSYWLKWRMTEDGKPLALYRLAPPFVKVIPGDFGVESYEYMVPGSGQREPLRFGADEVLHFRAANPHSPYIGMGVIQGGARPLDLELALTDSQASYFENRAQPSLIVQSERRVPDAVFKKMKAQLRGFYGGSSKAGALMVLEAGLKATSVSPNANDAGFEALTKMSRDRILSMFRVPKPLLGISDGTDQKINEAQRVFDTKTMRPLLDKFQWAITRGITQAWDADFVIEYDYIMPIEDRIKLASTFASLPGVKLREIREYAGLQPLGDERDEMVLNLPGEDGDKNGVGGPADRSLVGEPGRPPLPENTRAFPEPGGDLPAGSEVSRGKAMTVEDVSVRLDAILEGKAAVQFEKPQKNPVIVRPDDVLRTQRESELDLLTAETVLELSDVIHNLERGLLDHVEGKAFNPSDLSKRIRNSESWVGFKRALGVALERAVRSALSLGAMQQRGTGLSTDEIDYESVAKRVVYRPDGLERMVKTMKDELGEKLVKAIELDANQGEVDALVREYVAGWRASKAETIALTEVTHGYNEAVLSIAEANGVDRVFVFDGDDTDQPCKDANGSVWTIEEARARRVEHPRCRRAFTPYTEVS